MPKNRRIDDTNLQRALQERSIRPLVVEDAEWDEKLSDLRDTSQVTTATLDKLQGLLAPLEAIQSGDFAGYADQVGKVKSSVNSLATKGWFKRFVSGGGGEKASRLVGSINQLTAFSKAMGDRIKSDAGTPVANAIHAIPDDAKDLPLSTILARDDMADTNGLRSLG